jgi:5-methylcytosine-specific restriction endonuclease McrA
MTVSLGLTKTQPRTSYVRRKGISANRREYDRRRRRSPRSAETLAYMEVLRHDPCWVCGCNHAPGAVQDVDHIVPLDAGGLDTWENMAAACPPDNRGRKSRSLLDTLIRRTHG